MTVVNEMWASIKPLGLIGTSQSVPKMEMENIEQVIAHFEAGIICSLPYIPEREFLKVIPEGIVNMRRLQILRQILRIGAEAPVPVLRGRRRAEPVQPVPRLPPQFRPSFWNVSEAVLDDLPRSNNCLLYTSPSPRDRG